METNKNNGHSIRVGSTICLVFTILISILCQLCYLIPYITIFVSIICFFLIPIILIFAIALSIFEPALDFVNAFGKIHLAIQTFDYCGLILPYATAVLGICGISGIILSALSMKTHKKRGLAKLIVTSIFFALGAIFCIVGLTYRFK